ncbi:MAG: exosortase/archaeosortase family protein [Chthoniobacterales bacterium]
MSEPETIIAPAIQQRSEHGGRLRLVAAIAYFGLLAVFFGKDLYSLGIHAAGNQLHSHILLIPFIAAYLIYIQRAALQCDHRSSFVPGAIFAACASATTTFAHSMRVSGANENDYLALIALAVILFVIAGGFLFLGSRWMKASLFPAAFLLFAIPMPDRVADVLENYSKLGSAEVANWLFTLSGVPMLREGVYFQLPGITIEVAQECSGIRSSWVLLITSVLAAHMFLRTSWRRALLVLLVIPLGLLRNGLRIVVIGLLCVYVSPDMINSVIHHRGGPIFFIISLVPLFALLAWFRKIERAKDF